MQPDIIQVILDYVWVPIVTALTLLWSKFVGVDMRTKLLEQSEAHYRAQRLEDRMLRDEQRKEILDKIDKHHSLTMAKLDAVELRVKNGH